MPSHQSHIFLFHPLPTRYLSFLYITPAFTNMSPSLFFLPLSLSTLHCFTSAPLDETRPLGYCNAVSSRAYRGEGRTVELSLHEVESIRGIKSCMGLCSLKFMQFYSKLKHFAARTDEEKILNILLLQACIVYNQERLQVMICHMVVVVLVKSHSDTKQCSNIKVSLMLATLRWYSISGNFFFFLINFA